MKKIIVKITLAAALVGICAAVFWAKGTAKRDARFRMTAKQIFDYVEHTPKEKRARAVAFLQTVLDGKVRLARGPFQAAAETECDYVGDCDGHSCMNYNPETEMGYCSDCCVAVRSGASRP